MLRGFFSQFSANEIIVFNKKNYTLFNGVSFFVKNYYFDRRKLTEKIKTRHHIYSVFFSKVGTKK